MKIRTWDFFKIPEGIRIPYFGGKIYELISKIERSKIKKLDISSLNLNTEKREEKIIVSMTSFPSRIDVVGYAIKSLFNQTIKPDSIVLWLAEEQFAEFRIPEMLNDLCKQGLEIKFCDDLKAHKKYYYALKEQKKDELIVTYDDDLIYPEDSIERLYKTHLSYPGCIICNRAQESFSNKGKLTSYFSWKVNSKEGVLEPSTKLFPSTGGGTMYPFESVSKEAFNINIMKEVALTADDLWMRFMSALVGTKIIKTRKNHRTFTTIDGSQKESLQIVNCLEGENDRVLERLSTRYPNAVKAIIGDD